MTVSERFWSKVKTGGTCWFWFGSRDRYGYGKFAVGHRKIVKAHQFAYEQDRGPIPSGMVPDHLCKNPACVRPSHMEAVTPKENTMRGNGVGARHARQTECIHGHPLSGSNLHIAPDGERVCRRCGADRQANRRAKVKP